MLIPVVCGEDALLVGIMLGSGSVKHKDKLENFLIDADAVNALFDALTAFVILTGESVSRTLCVTPQSAAQLKSRNMYIAGDSLGLGVLLVLLEEASGNVFSNGEVCAATGALNVQSEEILCREVAKLDIKVACAAESGADIMYCPAQVDAPSERFRGTLVKQVATIIKDTNVKWRMKFV